MRVQKEMESYHQLAAHYRSTHDNNEDHPSRHLYREGPSISLKTGVYNDISLPVAQVNGAAMVMKPPISSAPVYSPQLSDGLSFLGPCVPLGNYHNQSSSGSAKGAASSVLPQYSTARTMLSHRNRVRLVPDLLLGNCNLPSPQSASRSSASSMAPQRSPVPRSLMRRPENLISKGSAIEPSKRLPISLSHLRSIPEPSLCPPVDLAGETDNVNIRASYRLAEIPLIAETAESCTDGCSSHDCSTESCDDRCSIDDCEPDCVQSCSGTEQCHFPELPAYSCEDAYCDDSNCYQEYYRPNFDCCPLEGGSEWPGLPPRPDIGPISPPHDCRWLMPGEQCNVSALTMNALGQHIFHDHIESQQTVTCPLEDCAELLDAQQASRHMMQVHNSDIYFCLHKGCGLEFPDEGSLAHHMEIFHRTLDCHWAGCEVSVTGSTQLQTHVNQAHLHIGFDGRWQPSKTSHLVPCPPSAYPGKTELPRSPPGRLDASPILSGSHSSPFETPKGSPYAGPSTAIANLKRLPSPAIPEPSPLSIHMGVETHSGSAECIHRCTWIIDPTTGQTCGTDFQTGNDLQAHVDHQHIWNKETYSSNYMPICGWVDCKRKGKPVQSREKLRRHLFTHTGYWMVSCDTCGKQFNNMASLGNHERVHTGEKPYHCKTCDLGFSTEGALTIHKRSHTGERPLVCPVCQYTSADSSNMTKHKKTHEPPEHFCKVCGRSFSRAATLERHMIIHDPHRPPRKRRSQAQSSA